MSKAPKPPTSPVPVEGQPPAAPTGIPHISRADEDPNHPARSYVGGTLPTYPPKPSDPEGTNTPTSPAGPGRPIDGSAAVNTYTPEEVQAAEYAAGAQDWQAAVATGIKPVELPEV